MEDLVRIGSVYRTHGLKGELKLIVETENLPDQFNPEVLYLESSPSPIPHFVSSFKYLDGNKAILKLEDTDTIEQAKQLVNKEVYAAIEQIVYSDEPRDFKHLLGYQLIDSKGTQMGIITDILDLPMQQVAQISYKGNDAMIPLMHETILKIDEKKQELHIHIPEGLLDIYE